jgi:glutamyl-tRNA synthetase
MGEGNKKLSKRDPESNLFHHRDRGFIPEGLINYLALLGWSLTHDRDVFSRMEMVTAFDVADVTPAPARFDLKKAESLNGDHIRLLALDDFAGRLVPYLQAAGVLGAEPSHEERRMLAAAAPLVQERMQLLGEAPDLLSFLFTTADELPYDDAAVQALKEDAPQVLAASRGALEGVPHTQWDIDLVQEVLQNTLITGMGMKPRVAYGPLRVGISGRRISPPLFESMVLLGKDETIARLDRLAGMLGA